jgi:hypothetical protein
VSHFILHDGKGRERVCQWMMGNGVVWIGNNELNAFSTGISIDLSSIGGARQQLTMHHILLYHSP